MDPYRRVTRSTSNAMRNPGESEGAFWGRMIDPTDIERGQAGGDLSSQTSRFR